MADTTEQMTSVSPYTSVINQLLEINANARKTEFYQLYSNDFPPETYLKEYSIVCVGGARQSGKTTWVLENSKLHDVILVPNDEFRKSYSNIRNMRFKCHDSFIPRIITPYDKYCWKTNLPYPTHDPDNIAHILNSRFESKDFKDNENRLKVIVDESNLTFKKLKRKHFFKAIGKVTEYRRIDIVLIN